MRRGTEIWAFKDGFAVVVAQRSPLRTRSPLLLTARRPTAEFVVLGPDGHPVPDALVSPGYVQCGTGSGEVSGVASRSLEPKDGCCRARRSAG